MHINPENTPSPDDFYPRMIYWVDHEDKIAQLVFYSDSTAEETEETLRFLESDEYARQRIRDTILKKAVNKHHVLIGGTINIHTDDEGLYHIKMGPEHSYELLQEAISEIVNDDKQTNRCLDGILLDLVSQGMLTNIEVEIDLIDSTSLVLDSDETFDNALQDFVESLKSESLGDEPGDGSQA